jgi:hypothetical protein
VVAVNVGGVIQFTIEKLPALGSPGQLLATGVLRQDLASTQSCLAGGGISSTRWEGVLVFEDPTVPSPPPLD